MFKAIKNIRLILDFLKRNEVNIKVFKENMMNLTPVIEDFKRLLNRLEF